MGLTSESEDVQEHGEKNRDERRALSASAQRSMMR